MFFNYVQDQNWYREFLKEIREEILEFAKSSTSLKYLDVGSGPGKLIELVCKETNNITCYGVDIDQSMLNLAKKRDYSGKKVKYYTDINSKDKLFKYFDIISFCSVLFLHDNPNRILDNYMKFLKSRGMILILTPTGKEGIYKRNYSHWTMNLWRKSTRKRAQEWNENDFIKKYSKVNSYTYKSKEVFEGLAKLEIIIKN
jgi:ubiquinone/menaquinone biosynthesis C-methylase UbiE